MYPHKTLKFKTEVTFEQIENLKVERPNDQTIKNSISELHELDPYTSVEDLILYMFEELYWDEINAPKRNGQFGYSYDLSDLSIFIQRLSEYVLL